MSCQIKPITKSDIVFYCDNDSTHKLNFLASSFNEAIETARETHKWHINQISFPARKSTDINEVLCPDCYRKKMEAWRNSNNLYEQIRGGKMFTYDTFKKAALKYLNIENHPKADKTFELAWEKGCSSGYTEVLSELEDLIQLIK